MLKEKIQNVLDLIQEANDIFDSKASWEIKYNLISFLNLEDELKRIKLHCVFPYNDIHHIKYQEDITKFILLLRKLEADLKKICWGTGNVKIDAFRSDD